MDYSSRWIRVAVPSDVATHIEGGAWRLDLYANTVAHERYADLGLDCSGLWVLVCDLGQSSANPDFL